jgi:hypothetical protein
MLRIWLYAAALAALTLGSAQAQSAAERPPDGTYTYRWSKGDQLAGQSTVSSHLRGSQIVVSTSSDITKNALAQARMTFGVRRLDFESYTGFMSSGGTDLSIDLTLQNRAVVGTAKTQALSYAINVAPFGPAPVFAVDDGVLGTFPFLPAQMRASSATSFQLISALSGTSGSINYSISTSGPYPYGVPSTDAVVSLGPDTTIWFNPQTLVVDQFARADLVARLLGKT